jgi:endo-1,4-beta-mannosidase
MEDAEISMDYCEKLFDALKSHEAILRISIMNEKSPLKKKNAENALDSLLSTLENYIRQKIPKTA